MYRSQSGPWSLVWGWRGPNPRTKRRGEMRDNGTRAESGAVENKVIADLPKVTT